MRTIRFLGAVAIAVILTVSFRSSVTAQQSNDESTFTRLQDVKFEHLPFLPDCLTIYVEHGDPFTGPSHVIFRMSPGCIIPWHWHSPNENLLVISGTFENEHRGEKPFIMHSGDYAYLPSHHPHRGVCRGPEPCTGYLYSDATSDVHWIDEQNGEISIEDALKAVNPSQFAPKQTPVKP